MKGGEQTEAACFGEEVCTINSFSSFIILSFNYLIDNELVHNISSLRGLSYIFRFLFQGKKFQTLHLCSTKCWCEDSKDLNKKKNEKKSKQKKDTAALGNETRMQKYIKFLCNYICIIDSVLFFLEATPFSAR